MRVSSSLSFSLCYPCTHTHGHARTEDAQPIITKNSCAFLKKYIYFCLTRCKLKKHHSRLFRLGTRRQTAHSCRDAVRTCCPTLNPIAVEPIGEAASGLYGVRFVPARRQPAWRMMRAKFPNSRCDLQPASELSLTAPCRGNVKLNQTPLWCSTSEDAYRKTKKIWKVN